jgi:hypothetical protein
VNLIGWKNLRDFFEEQEGLELPGTPTFCGFPYEDHDIYDASLTLDQWIEIYVAQIKKTGSLRVPLLEVLLQVLTTQELETMDEQVKFNGYDDAPTILQYAGQYEMLRKHASWSQLREKVVNLEHRSWGQLIWPWPDPSTPLSSPTEPQTVVRMDRYYLKLEDRTRLCQNFAEMGVIGNSDPMARVYHQIDQLCRAIQHVHRSGHLPNVLLVSPPGEGKGLIADAIHKMSGREGKLVAINCAGLSHELLESDLFGHLSGAFTGAPYTKTGRIENAKNGGTVLLDELDKAPLDIQARLLRALQERTANKVGSQDSYSLDNVLFLAAVNRKGHGGVDEGRSSLVNDTTEALYGRLVGEEILMPQLAVRSVDIPLLVAHFLKRLEGSPLDQHRFPLAVWCQWNYSSIVENSVEQRPSDGEWETEDGVYVEDVESEESEESNRDSGEFTRQSNVRALENHISRLVHRSLPPTYLSAKLQDQVERLRLVYENQLRVKGGKISNVDLGRGLGFSDGSGLSPAGDWGEANKIVRAEYEDS